MQVLITGAAGSGTTTLGRARAARCGIAFFDADDFFRVSTQPPYTEKARQTNGWNRSCLRSVWVTMRWSRAR